MFKFPRDEIRLLFVHLLLPCRAWSCSSLPTLPGSLTLSPNGACCSTILTSKLYVLYYSTPGKCDARYGQPKPPHLPSKVMQHGYPEAPGKVSTSRTDRSDRSRSIYYVDHLDPNLLVRYVVQDLYRTTAQILPKKRVLSIDHTGYCAPTLQH